MKKVMRMKAKKLRMLLLLAEEATVCVPKVSRYDNRNVVQSYPLSNW